MSISRLAALAERTNALLEDSNKTQKTLIKQLVITNWVNIVTIAVALVTLIVVLIK